MIRKKTEGVLLYLRQEGRGIGLENKLKAYQLQDEGMDTVEANLSLGFEADYRKYDIAAEMLKYLGVQDINLISNNMNKVNGISKNGVSVSKRIPIVINSPARDRNDLFKIKQKKLGHVFDKLDDISVIEESKSEKYRLSSPNLFIKNTPVSKIAQENTENIKKNLIENF
jgi:3,4-dihydroxy 2-butanone 4-phosphate synthase / GTP cyclohydrolase II